MGIRLQELLNKKKEKKRKERKGISVCNILQELLNKKKEKRKEKGFLCVILVSKDGTKVSLLN